MQKWSWSIITDSFPYLIFNLQLHRNKINKTFLFVIHKTYSKIFTLIRFLAIICVFGAVNWRFHKKKKFPVIQNTFGPFLGAKAKVFCFTEKFLSSEVKCEIKTTTYNFESIKGGLVRSLVFIHRSSNLIRLLDDGRFGAI